MDCWRLLGSSSGTSLFCQKGGALEGGKRAYSRGRGQSKEGSEHILGAGANRRRGESIFPGQGPIEGGERAYRCLYGGYV
eukprot:2156477-Pyramimonas_sp.AAC.1